MTDWESCYLEGSTPWDKGTPSPPLTEWVTKNTPAGRALVPGCGVGHDVAMLAEKGVDAHGLDLAPTAIERARAAYPTLQQRFHLGDLLKWPEAEAAGYDFIFEHTCLCALPPAMRADYAEAVFKLLKPGGRLVGIWFINPDMEPGEDGPPFGIPTTELEALFPASRWQVVEDYTPAVAFEGREGREQLRVLRRLP